MKAPKNKKSGSGKKRDLQHLLIGGDITKNNGTVDADYRRYKTGPLASIQDAGIGAVDAGLSGFGGENIIKDKHYQTSGGAKFNEANNVVQAGARQVGGAVVNYFVPGLGTAATGAMGALNSGIGQDEAISQKTNNTVSGINKAGAGLGALTSAFSKAPADNTVQNVPTSTATAPSMALNADQQSQYDSALTQTDKDALMKGWSAAGLATGGTIKGAGSGLSDSIKADLDEGGFVAIARKKEEAEVIRKKYLGSKGKIASLRGGDTPVKVSNGETYFTEEEKELIISKGGEKELNSLAPEAKQKAKGEYVAGGGIFANDAPRMTQKERAQLGYENDKLKADLEGLAVTNETSTPNPYSGLLDLAKYQESVTGTNTGTVPPVTTNSSTPEIKQEPKANWFTPSKIERAGSGLQLGLGLAALAEQGKRPVDQMPADYVNAIDKVGRDATYGLSPQATAQARRDFELQRRRNVQDGISASGGDAVSALNYAKHAGILKNDAVSKLAIEDENLRQRKFNNYTGLLGNKADLSRRLFDDKLNAFNVDQNAGAGLVGAGIHNLIGGSRFDREVAAGLKRDLGYSSSTKLDDGFSQSDIDYKFSTLAPSERAKHKSSKDWANSQGYTVNS